MPSGEFDDLGDLGFRDVVGKNAADADTVPMNVQHNFHRGFPALVEDLLQYVNDELHRRIVVVEYEHLIQAGLFGFGPCLGNDAGASVTVPRSLATLAPTVPSVFHFRVSQTYMVTVILVDKGAKQSPATGYRERLVFRIKKRKGPGKLPGPCLNFSERNLSGASVLNDVHPRLNTTLDWREGFLARRG